MEMTLGQIWPLALAIVSTGSVLLSIYAKLYGINRKLDEAMPRNEADRTLSNLRETFREHCSTCRKEIDLELAKKATGVEMVAARTSLLELRESNARLEERVKGFSDKLDEILGMIRLIAER